MRSPTLVRGLRESSSMDCDVVPSACVRKLSSRSASCFGNASRFFGGPRLRATCSTLCSRGRPLDSVVCPSRRGCTPLLPRLILDRRASVIILMPMAQAEVLSTRFARNLLVVRVGWLHVTSNREAPHGGKPREMIPSNNKPRCQGTDHAHWSATSQA